jgi:hypothetical protein
MAGEILRCQEALNKLASLARAGEPFGAIPPGPGEWTVSVIFRKPIDLSKTIEFEPGIGPEWK